MIYALGWLVVAILIALWSLTAWALHAAAAWAVSNAGALARGTPDELQLPQWLAAWVPPELAQALGALWAGVAPAVDSLLQAAPALAGLLGVAGWVIWGIGSALLILLGVGVHLLIAMWRRRGGGAGSVVARRLPA